MFLTRDAHEHHQTVPAEGRPDAVSFNVVNQISFRAEALDDLRAMKPLLAAEGVTGIRQTSHGVAWSIYFLDPEDNRIEIFADTPWCIHQPPGDAIDLTESDAIDLTESDAGIMARTERHARNQPEFESLASWREAMTKKIEDAAS